MQAKDLKTVTNVFYWLFFTSISIVSLGSKASEAELHNDTWHTWKNTHNSAVHYRPAPQKGLIEIKADITLNTTHIEFIKFLHEESLIHKWLDNVDRAIIRMTSASSSVLILTFDAFWPVSPRIMAVKSEIVRVDNRTIEIHVINNLLESNDEFIQITLHRGSWRIKQVDNGRVNITYKFVADANGNVPLWLANKLALKSIWKTLNKIHEHYSTNRD